jgi:hypothetical protein
LKIKKTPKPKSKFSEEIPEDDHDDDGGHHDEDSKEEGGDHHDEGPKEEGDESDEAKDILKEEPAPFAPLPVMKEAAIVDPNPFTL